MEIVFYAALIFLSVIVIGFVISSALIIINCQKNRQKSVRVFEADEDDIIVGYVTIDETNKNNRCLIEIYKTVQQAEKRTGKERQ